MRGNNQPWIRKYCPSRISEIVAQETAMSFLKKYLSSYKDQKKKAILLYGPSGCGKTSSVYAIAADLNLEVIEVNASDFRNKEGINSTVGAASQQMSLFGKEKLILVDEIDGVAGRKDYGGIPALVRCIQASGWPIVMTANNPFDNKFSSLRNKSEMLGFKELNTDDVYSILKDICLKENLSYDEMTLKTMARRSAGDARGAVTDLQIAASLSKTIDENSVLEIDARDKVDSMLTALVKVFKSTDVLVAKSAFDTVQEDFDQRFLWLDENLPKEYENPVDLARAYDKLSKADVFRGRIRRRQHWRYLVFVNDLMSAGVASAKDIRKKDFVAYKPTGRLLKIWWANQKSMKKKAIALKIAAKTHTSQKQVLKNFEFFKTMFMKSPAMASDLVKELDLDKDEVAYMKK